MSDELTLETAGWRKRELPGYIGLVGPLWTRKEESGWAYAILASEAHLNPAGVVHGGLMASLLDHALSTLAWEAAGRSPCLTVQLDTQYIGTVSVGQLVEVRGSVVKKTSSLVFMRGTVTTEGDIVAAATAILKRVAPRKTEHTA